MSEIKFEIKEIKCVQLNDRYLVFSDGRVYMLPDKCNRYMKGRWLTQSLTNAGYLRLNKLKGTKERHVHRLISKCFIPNPKNLPQVNHKNGNRLDNRSRKSRMVHS